MQRVYDEIRFKDDVEDPQLIIYKRMYILSWACALGHQDCVGNSVKLFGEWMRSRDPDAENPYVFFGSRGDSATFQSVSPFAGFHRI